MVMNGASSVSYKNKISYLLALHRLPLSYQISLLRWLKAINTVSDRSEGPSLEYLLENMPSLRFHHFDWVGVERDLQWWEAENNHIVTVLDPEYPALLKHLTHPPLVLFVQGDKTLLKTPQIAMVGSRKPTVHGVQIASQFARYLVGHGWTVTSGLALGIDTVCHRGALENRGKTLAVLAHGLDRIYPFANETFSREIVERGALLSEFPPGTPPLPHHFPQRNRLISGLSQGVVVVEAALKSGSLITARWALEQGKEVFAVPGSIYSHLTKGCHALIREGALLVETPEEIVSALRVKPHYRNGEI